MRATFGYSKTAGPNGKYVKSGKAVWGTDDKFKATEKTYDFDIWRGSSGFYKIADQNGVLWYL